MSSIFDFFEHLFSSTPHPPTRIVVKSSNYVSSSLSPDQIKTASGTPAAANQHYVRIWATHMLLSESMKWLTTVYPAVYSIVHLRFGDDDQDLANLAGPKQLGNLKPADQDHSKLINQPLTGLLPFRGGTVRLSCGLASVPATNILSNFLNTVSDFAGKLAQPQVSAGITLASSIATGVQSLLGAGDTKLMLYYDTTYTGLPGEQALQSGFVFLSDVKAGTISSDQLWIIDGEPRIGSTAANAGPITGQNYVLLQIEVRTDRDDWGQFKDIEVPLQEAISAKISGKQDDASKFLIAAKLAAFNSQDLTEVDRKRVLLAIDTEFSSVAAITGPEVSATAAATPRSLVEVMKSAISFSEARNLTAPTARQLLSTPGLSMP
jgi:hypothetical protein